MNILAFLGLNLLVFSGGFTSAYLLHAHLILHLAVTFAISYYIMPIIENKFIDNCESALYPAYKFFHGVPALTYFSGCIIAYGSLDKNTMGSILIAWMAGHICSGLYSFIGKKISPPEERQERWQAKQQQDRSEELSAVMEKMRDAPREELEAAIKKVFPECKVVIEEAADDVVNDAGTVHHSKRIVKIVG